MPVGMQHDSYREAWLEGPGQHHFYTRTYLPSNEPKASIIFIHGFADHISRYTDVHASWAQDGYVVFAYDLRGFGRTALDKPNCSPDAQYAKTSGREHHQDLLYWINYLTSSWTDIPIFLCGYSMVSLISDAALTLRDLNS